jgi:hypothetical protein
MTPTPLAAAALLALLTVTPSPSAAQGSQEASRLERLSGGDPAIVQRLSVFATAAALAPGDLNAEADVYVRDTATGEVELISAGPDGRTGAWASEEPALSADGHVVAFVTRNAWDPTDRNGTQDVYVYDRRVRAMMLASRAVTGGAGNARSSQPSVSADGSQVAFASMASNLVGEDRNGTSDVFVWHRPTDHVRLVSMLPNGEQIMMPSYLPSISSNGLYIGFETSLDGTMSEDAELQFYMVRLYPGLDGLRNTMWRLEAGSLVEVVPIEAAFDLPADQPRIIAPSQNVPRPFGR